MTRGGAAAVRAEPNMTPMIDVMLVLLIIFMVVTPVLATGVVAEPPHARNLREHPEDEDQLLAIDNRGAYFLNRRPIPRDELGEGLRRLFAEREDKVLYVVAHRELPYAAVREAMDVAATSGVRVLGMVSEQQRDRETPRRASP